MIRKTLALELLDKNGSKLLKWYSSTCAVRHAMQYHDKLTTDTSVWVCWTFDKEGNKLLLFSSRPLPFSYVEPSILI